MPSLDAVLSDTMFVAADASGLRQPLPPGEYWEFPPEVSGAAPGDQALWSWRHDPDTPADVVEIEALTRSMGYMSMRVLDRVHWGPVEFDDPATGARLSVPMDGIQVARRLYLPTGRLGGGHPIWPLPAAVDPSLLVVFVAERDPADPGNFLPVEEEVLAADDFLPAPDTGSPDQPLRVVVACELVLCRESADFEPLGVLGAARVRPHVMVMTNQPVANLSVAVALARPARSPMSDPQLTPDVQSGLFADTNDNTVRLNWIMQTLQAMSPVPVPDLPLWDNIFDYYRLDPSPGASFAVVDPAAAKRLVTGAIETYDMVGGSYQPMPFEKWPGQGAYDNIHMAPRMLAGSPQVGPDPVTMAPVCQHDCLHIHWRWGGMWRNRPGLILPNARALMGWNALGQPYAEPGAPMVPRDQRITVTTDSPSAFRYRADIANVSAGRWQYVFHHGCAYGVSLDNVNDAIKYAMAAANLFLASILQGPLPPAISIWRNQEWAQFYSLLRFHPTLSGPQERIHVVNPRAAES